MRRRHPLAVHGGGVAVRPAAAAGVSRPPRGITERDEADDPSRRWWRWRRRLRATTTPRRRTTRLLERGNARVPRGGTWQGGRGRGGGTWRDMGGGGAAAAAALSSRCAPRVVVVVVVRRLACARRWAALRGSERHLRVDLFWWSCAPPTLSLSLSTRVSSIRHAPSVARSCDARSLPSAILRPSARSLARSCVPPPHSLARSCVPRTHPSAILRPSATLPCPILRPSLARSPPILRPSPRILESSNPRILESSRRTTTSSRSCAWRGSTPWPRCAHPSSVDPSTSCRVVSSCRHVAGAWGVARGTRPDGNGTRGDRRRSCRHGVSSDGLRTKKHRPRFCPGGCALASQASRGCVGRCTMIVCLTLYDAPRARLAPHAG